MTMNMLANAGSLSNQDLLVRLVVLAANERHSSAELVAHLAALQERPTLYVWAFRSGSEMALLEMGQGRGACPIRPGAD